MSSEYQDAVIGCIALAGERAMGECVAYGAELEWFHGQPRRVYKTAMDLFAIGVHFDLVILAETLREHDENTDWTILLNRCASEAVVASNLRRYLSGLEAVWLKRHAIATAQANLDTLKSATSAEIRERIADVHGAWTVLCTQREDQITLGQAARQFLEDCNRERPRGLPWPLRFFNRLMAPLTDELVYLVAQQSVGKTAFALQWAVALSQGNHKVGFASLESGTLRIAPRVISQIAQVNTLNLRLKRGQVGDYQRAMVAVDKIEKLPLYLADRSMTVEQIYAWARSMKAKGVEIIFIDNMKHIRCPAAESTVAQFRELSARLKFLRDDIKLPVVVLHHLTDAGDVSWSKDIKRDADILLYMTDNDSESHPPCPANDYKGTWVVDIEVKKNRDGVAFVQTSTEFAKEYQTFLDPETQEEFDAFNKR